MHTCSECRELKGCADAVSMKPEEIEGDPVCENFFPHNGSKLYQKIYEISGDK